MIAGIKRMRINGKRWKFWFDLLLGCGRSPPPPMRLTSHRRLIQAGFFRTVEPFVY